MRKVASISFDAMPVLGKVLAECSLVQVVELLSTRLLLRLDDRNWHKLCERLLLLLATVAVSLPLQRLFTKNKMVSLCSWCRKFSLGIVTVTEICWRGESQWANWPARTSTLPCYDCTCSVTRLERTGAIVRKRLTSICDNWGNNKVLKAFRNFILQTDMDQQKDKILLKNQSKNQIEIN